MNWNPLVPELSVSDFERSLDFYTRGVGFETRYTRSDPQFAYLDLNGAQLMLEADHADAWRTGELREPRGVGLNLQVEVPDVNEARLRLLALECPVFRDIQESWYETADGPAGQIEFLIQDPDGYLIRLTENL